MPHPGAAAGRVPSALGAGDLGAEVHEVAGGVAHLRDALAPRHVGGRLDRMPTGRHPRRVRAVDVVDVEPQRDALPRTRRRRVVIAADARLCGTVDLSPSMARWMPFVGVVLGTAAYHGHTNVVTRDGLALVTTGEPGLSNALFTAAELGLEYRVSDRAAVSVALGAARSLDTTGLAATVEASWMGL